MRILIEVPEPQADKLRAEAHRLGVKPEVLATAAVVDFLNREASDFSTASEYVRRRNKPLYRRLS